MRDREPPGVQIIAESHAHICQRLAVFIQSHAGLVTHFGKVAVAIVLVQIILRAIVSHEQFEFSVVVEIRPDGSQAEQFLRIVDAGLFETSLNVPSPLL